MVRWRWLVLVLVGVLVTVVLAGVGAASRRRPGSVRLCRGIAAISVVGTVLLVGTWGRVGLGWAVVEAEGFVAGIAHSIASR